MKVEAMAARISSAVAIVRRLTHGRQSNAQINDQSRGATIKATTNGPTRHAMKRAASHAKYAKACRQTGLLLNGLLLNGLLPSDLLSSGRRNRW